VKHKVWYNFRYFGTTMECVQCNNKWYILQR